MLNVDELKKEIKKHQNSEPKIIRAEDERLAFGIVGLFRPLNIYDCFVIFSAGTLINAYVKKPYAQKPYKKNYSFKRFICTRVEELLKKPIKDVKVLHSSGFTVVDVNGLKFSYHSLGDPHKVANSSIGAANSAWNQDKLRLTPYALQLFQLSEKLINDDKVSKINKETFLKIQEYLKIEDQDAGREQTQQREKEINAQLNM